MTNHQLSEQIPKSIQKELDKVTVKPHRKEVLFDPVILSILQDKNSTACLDTLANDPERNEERQQQIERLKQAACRVLQGREKKCVLLLLSGYENYTSIGKEINLSRDSVRRAIQAAVPKLKEAIQQRQPDEHNKDTSSIEKKPVLKSKVMPLNTEKEKKEFQEWINRHQVMHVALAAMPQREVLVLYQHVRGC